ncbi:pyridoxal 5'-phosphate synthase [Virgibacillus necropolis]|uniref:pyridoxine/pyridoxamine 5'-phosphate oxidase n=1 Tax=Virgibacillus necropolis TaxID=163877 RepID=UPI00384ED34E
MMTQIRKVLRNLKSLEGPFPDFDSNHLPNNPADLFQQWLTVAIEKSVREPHAMTLSTVDNDGAPDARVLILKDVTPNHWYFATSSASRKGEQLESNQKVALTFYWKEIGRQVRIRGTACEMDPSTSAKDFLGRSISSRALALIGNPSQEMKTRDELDKALVEANKLLQQDQQIVSTNWKLYAVLADEVEFWQGDPERKHTRVKYQRDGESWKSYLLWP